MLFVLEVDVDRALGDAGSLGDLIERRGGIAIAGKLGESGLQNFLRTLRLAAASRFPGAFPTLPSLGQLAINRSKSQVID